MVAPPQCTTKLYETFHTVTAVAAIVQPVLLVTGNAILCVVAHRWPLQQQNDVNCAISHIGLIVKGSDSGI